jgi:hypothetical protein
MAPAPTRPDFRYIMKNQLKEMPKTMVMMFEMWETFCKLREIR